MATAALLVDCGWHTDFFDEFVVLESQLATVDFLSICMNMYKHAHTRFVCCIFKKSFGFLLLIVFVVSFFCFRLYCIGWTYIALAGLSVTTSEDFLPTEALGSVSV